ncbi:hypothetical protein CK203_018356 [Vitis vinifera]|uniref:Reverse transcriptase zinc-binding domain-containing protein n=1 Tax=Vitis vinifera TaxID=29760 RepID=A0A438JPH8_VITVI|nr:hypothetical protein CK203_018356 [Vitis vinifera]
MGWGSEAIKMAGRTFELTRFIVGDGTRVKFWKDVWCENQSLENAFPNLFNLIVNKEGGGEVESLLSKLHPLTIRRGVDGLLWWRENKNGTFSVKASFFGWEAAWSRLLTIDRLRRSGWSIPNRCYLCKNEEETIGGTSWDDMVPLWARKGRKLGELPLST